MDETDLKGFKIFVGIVYLALVAAAVFMFVYL